MPATSPLLVVEDDDIVRMLMVDVLQELGYEVKEAGDGEEALALLGDPQQPFALMLTDVGLPGMDGKELARQTRELRPLLPILFASGYGQSLEVPEGMHLISKPFSIDQLREKMRGILG
ncbi:response regulator [Pseudomonas sp. zfem002]|uniref:response regulator n=1 Tax=Pseudomonas sp. zfem002 TaxID=3078197 RepID=UPI002928BCB9|nr:response regulator [Pseudomonas sp. zfem002]MDU9393372.1 response regulator [Pseudomonas sp. zfem002]